MNPQNYYAAIDLGSNSFHMIIVRADGNSLQIVDSVKHMVRLGEGLDENGHLSAASIARGLEALTQMEQMLRHIPRDQVRVVATNTLRVAENGADFLRNGEATLGVPIEISAGKKKRASSTSASPPTTTTKTTASSSTLAAVRRKSSSATATSPSSCAP